MFGLRVTHVHRTADGDSFLTLMSCIEHWHLRTLQQQARDSDNDDEDDDEVHHYDKRQPELVSASHTPTGYSAVTSRLSALKARLEADRSRGAASPEDDRCDVLCMHALTVACTEIRQVEYYFSSNRFRGYNLCTFQAEEHIK